MDERQELLDWVQDDLRRAETALHQGDAAPRHALWSRQEPVSVLGAWRSAVGQQQVRALFDELGPTFSDCLSYEHEVLACDVVGDVGWTVGYEHTRASVRGEPRDYTLRVTQVYRREAGEWRVAHRHADTVT